MNILVAIDFSTATASILQAARDWTLRSGKDAPHLYLLHVAEPDPAFVGWEAGPDVVRDQTAEVFHQEPRELGELADGLRAEGVEDVTPLLVQGAAEARSTDLLRCEPAGHSIRMCIQAGRKAPCEQPLDDPADFAARALTSLAADANPHM